MYLGMDIGSVSLNLVLLDGTLRVQHEEYVRTLGRPLQTALNALEELTARVPLDEIEGVAFTGAGTAAAAELYGIEPVNEIIAHARAAEALCPDVRTILEIGGEDSKVILLAEDEGTGRLHIHDFAMNTLCAAGTGSFLDQQASRLGVSIEDEWGRMALRCTRVPRIAGRCSVFAKSDMIHLQQEGTPAEDIVAGLCFAMARNLVAVVGKGKEFRPRIAFQGGVAANTGMVRAFTEILGLEPGELLVPEHFASMGAIGAVLVNAERQCLGRIPSLGPIRERLSRPSSVHVAAHSPLRDDGYPIATEPEPLNGDGECVDVFVGVDVGSISTNVVAIDCDGRVLAREYLMTAGQPLAAVTDALFRVGSALEERADGGIRVRGCATTGSGRYLTGDFIGADAVRNEITAHATGAAFVRPDVDTVFDIGGQDSKYISLKNGVVVDFTMNKVCAAGTGSFVEEQSERLGVGLKTGEFGELALSAQGPTVMGDRCTVFMETDVNRRRNQGATMDDLCAGLCYSIVRNYLDRVVAGRPVGSVVLFQGGTAYNRGIKSAMEEVLEREIVVPPHHDVMGAVGMALIARDWYRESQAESQFKGFDMRDVRYDFDAFECQECPNACEIHVVKIRDGAGGRDLHYGSRCGKFDETARDESESSLPKPFTERQRLLDEAYSKRKPDRPNGKTIGVPKMTHTWELLPMWRALFTELGFEVVTSGRTNRTLIQSGVEEVAAETCFPIKVSHGHIRDLVTRDVDYIFLPTIVDMHDSTGKAVNSFTCPYVQAVPYMAKAGMEDVDWDGKLVAPILHFSQPESVVRRDLEDTVLGLGVGRAEARRAIGIALDVQRQFGEALRKRGQEILDGIGDDELALVVISRAYNGCDPGLNMHIPDKLRSLGCLAIPLDMLPLDEDSILDDYPFMYWKYGTRILSAARIVAGDPRLYPVYITNFGCGPDSFIMKFVERELFGKPCLTLEVDEHSADAGIITRCEAFLDSLTGARQNAGSETGERPPSAFGPRPDPGEGRLVYISYMDDHGYAVAAAMRACGVNARQMPISDESSRAWGRRHTSGKECYPCVITTGDILRQVDSPGFDRDATAFFMPTAYGPCRFGQYCRFHRMVLDDLGYDDVPMVLLDQAQDYYKDADKLGADFRKLAWRGVVFVDTLQKMLRETRPYEVAKGETDEVYTRYLHRSAEVTEARGDLTSLAREARRAFGDVEVDRSQPRPLIGIVGEIFVRSNEFVNNFIVRKIEASGAETIMPPFEEWLNYIAWSRQREARKQGNWKLMATEKLTGVVQRHEKRKVLREFRGAIRGSLEEPQTEEIIRLARNYLDPSVRGGETVLSLGRSMEYVHGGCDGIVNLHPFNCMPGAIVNAILTRLQKDHDIPVLKVAYDGQEQSNEHIRIEAFVHQCRERMESRSGTRRGTASEEPPPLDEVPERVGVSPSS